MLELIRKLTPNCKNLVKFFEHFEYTGQTFLVFEMLDGDLCDLIRERGYEPLALEEIRPIVKQVYCCMENKSILE